MEQFAVLLAALKADPRRGRQSARQLRHPCQLRYRRRQGPQHHQLPDPRRGQRGREAQVPERSLQVERREHLDGAAQHPPQRRSRADPVRYRRRPGVDELHRHRSLKRASRFLVRFQAALTSFLSVSAGLSWAEATPIIKSVSRTSRNPRGTLRRKRLARETPTVPKLCEDGDSNPDGCYPLAPQARAAPRTPMISRLQNVSKRQRTSPNARFRSHATRIRRTRSQLATRSPDRLMEANGRWKAGSRWAGTAYRLSLNSCDSSTSDLTPKAHSSTLRTRSKVDPLSFGTTGGITARIKGSLACRNAGAGETYSSKAPPTKVQSLRPAQHLQLNPRISLIDNMHSHISDDSRLPGFEAIITDAINDFPQGSRRADHQNQYPDRRDELVLLIRAPNTALCPGALLLSRSRRSCTGSHRIVRVPRQPCLVPSLHQYQLSGDD